MMEDLATVEDLRARGITFADEAVAKTYLAAVSAAVRDAAGCLITKTTSTFVVPTEPSRRIVLPVAVRRVLEVTLNGQPVTDWHARGVSLWRDEPWHYPGEIPGQLTVTVEHGLDEVPADIVNLVCTLTAAGLKGVEEGSHRGVQNVRLDGIGITYTTGDDEIVDLATDIPDRTRRMLRNRFGRNGTTVSGGVR